MRCRPGIARVDDSKSDAHCGGAHVDAPMDALTNLLDAETADVVHELLDDGCRAWCDDLSAGARARGTRLGKNAKKIKSKLRMSSDADAMRVAEACETYVRECVWRRGRASESGTSEERETREVGWPTTHEKLNALLRARETSRGDKWRDKAEEASRFNETALIDFDWVVRARAGGTRDRESARVRLALRCRTAGVDRDVRFEIPRDVLERTTRSLARARDALGGLVGDPDAGETEAPSSIEL